MIEKTFNDLLDEKTKENVDFIWDYLEDQVHEFVRMFRGEDEWYTVDQYHDGDYTKSYDQYPDKRYFESYDEDRAVSDMKEWLNDCIDEFDDYLKTAEDEILLLKELKLLQWEGVESLKEGESTIRDVIVMLWDDNLEAGRFCLVILLIFFCDSDENFALLLKEMEKDWLTDIFDKIIEKYAFFDTDLEKKVDKIAEKFDKHWLDIENYHNFYKGDYHDAYDPDEEYPDIDEDDDDDDDDDDE